jgi:hypothetical protein
MTHKDKTVEVEKFLDAHPELKALTEAQCRESEDAALRLLRREDARSLLLPLAEVEPWFPVFERRISESPGILDALQDKSDLKAEDEKALADLMYTTGGEMAVAIFAEERLQQLVEAIHDYRRGLSRKDRDCMTGVNGALMAAQSSAPAGENHFLAMLCWTSFMSVVRDMHDEPDM